MRYDVVLFDLDGTLTASAPGIMRCAQVAAEQLGFNVEDENVFSRFIGPPLFASFRDEIGMTDEQAVEAMRLYRVRYDVLGWKENAVYTGIPVLLRALKQQGTRIALATAKPINFATRILDYYGLSRYFDTQIGISQKEKHADKAVIVKQALEAVDFKSGEKAAMVGDRLFDIEGALANGIDAIGAAFGYGSREELEKAGAHAVADEPSELLDILASPGTQPKGLFVSIEGLDGSGKTSQIERISHYLSERGFDVLSTREPGGSPIGEKIRELVLDPQYPQMEPLTEALLYAAQRAQHMREVIAPALSEGKFVLGDRYVDASAAFQGGGRQLGIDTVLAINAPAVGNVMPDATMLFRVNTEVAMARRSGERELDRIEQEKEAFHRRVCDAYDELVRRNPERIIPVDATGSIEETSNEALKALEAILARV